MQNKAGFPLNFIHWFIHNENDVIDFLSLVVY